MRSLLSAIVWVVASSATAQQLLDDSYGKSPEEQDSIVWICNIEGQDPQIADQPTCSESTKSIAQQACYDSPDTSTCQYLGGFEYSGSGNHTFRARDSDGDYLRNITYGYTIYTQVETAYLCPPTAFPSYDRTLIATSGNSKCFDVVDLLSRDTCPTAADYNLLPVSGNDLSTGYTCQQLTDGSSCKYVPDETGEFLINDPEGSICYNPQVPTYDDSGLNAPTNPIGQCENIGNGVVACPEDPLNVCPNGQCQEGCGNMAFNGSPEVFVCLSDDTDGDGIGDYADPDIDGDGIPNTDDPDADGDGQDDPQYGDDSSSDVVVTVNVDEQAIADGVVDGLTEQGDFDGTDTINAIQSGINELETSVDNLLNDPNFDLKNTVGESGIESSLSSATNMINPSSCSASFTMPLSGTQLDLCSAMEDAKPFLWVLFAFGTFLYCWTRISSTVRSDS